MVDGLTVDLIIILINLLLIENGVLFSSFLTLPCLFEMLDFMLFGFGYLIIMYISNAVLDKKTLFPRVRRDLSPLDMGRS